MELVNPQATITGELMIFQNETCELGVPWSRDFRYKDLPDGYECVYRPSDECEIVRQRRDNHGGPGCLVNLGCEGMVVELIEEGHEIYPVEISVQCSFDVVERVTALA